MNKINLHITEANDNLLSYEKMIKLAAQKAQKYAFPQLQINWDVDIIVTNRAHHLLIPEDGVGGITYSSDFILVDIDESKITEDLLLEALLHELCHAARWGKNDERMNTLIDGMINEGIATWFEADFVKKRQHKQFFIKTIVERSDEENQKILDYLRDKLYDKQYDYHTIFFDGNKKLPRWSGYSVGYMIVKRYLQKTGKSINEVFADNYSDIESVL